MHQPSESDMWAMHVVKAASWFSLTFLCWERCITFDDEVDCIWMTPKVSLNKVLYLFARYFPLIGQIINHIIVTWLQTRFPVPHATCRAWWTYQAIVAQVLMTSIELILMIRVHALYNRSRRVVMLLSSIFSAELAIVAFSFARSVVAVKYNNVCLVETMPHELLIMSSGPALTQSVILALTVAKHALAMRNGYGRTPIVSLMIRDGAKGFIIVSALLLIALFHFVFQNILANILFFAFIAILPSVGCRLIVNMQRLAIPRPEYQDSVVQLSTYMGDLGLSRDGVVS